MIMRRPNGDRAREIAQWVGVLATKAEGLRVVPGIHVVGRKNRMESCKLSPGLHAPTSWAPMHVHVCTYLHTKSTG